jgi:hypothetical protein
MRIGIRLLLLSIAICCYTCAASGQTVPTADHDIDRVREQAFNAFNPRYKQLRDERIRRAVSLGKRVFAMEAKGQNIACAHQILNETKWLLGDSADFPRIDGRLDALENLLAHPEQESTATTQDPADGSWGHCYTEWFFKLDATFDHLDQNATHNLQTDVPFRFLDRVNSPAKLRAYFRKVSVSNIPKDGVDNSRELNESIADLMRLILWDRPTGYRWNPHLKPVLMDIVLHSLRNPETGWWGERYVIDGHPVFVDYLSLTFHIVRYLDGKVPGLEQTVETTLAVKDLNEPSGWLSDGQLTDHNNMDVAVLFQYGWSAASGSQRKAMAEQIQKMLDWCLAQSLQPDGTFAHGGDNSIEENEYFGAAFLSRIGFFDPHRRFWTNQDFPAAPEVRERITRYILQHRDSGAAGGTYYEHALQDMISDPAYLKAWSSHPD